MQKNGPEDSEPPRGKPIVLPECPPGWRTGPPDFVGIGVHRSGTSRWYKLLVAHPHVSQAPGMDKELHYFDRFWDGRFESEDIDRYHLMFPRWLGSICGEWTPGYMHHSWTPRLLARAAPEAKLITILRDPLDRYRSHMSIHVAKRTPTGFSAIHAQDMLARGLYAQQLRRVLRQVPREQLLVLQFEQCLADPETELRRTYRFLGLDEEFVPDGLTERVNRGPREVSIPAWLEQDLSETFAEDAAGLLDIAPELDLSLWPSVRALV